MIVTNCFGPIWSMIISLPFVPLTYVHFNNDGKIEGPRDLNEYLKTQW